ncbi:MAG: molybdopterin molybdotransferase MoeA [Rhodothermales bacterium]
MRTFLSVGPALRLVLDDVRKRDDEWLEPGAWLDADQLHGILGRRISRDVVATVDVPDFASSAMDGYAVRHEDLGPDGGVLRVVSHAAAGRPTARPLTAGEAVRIMTGAPVPVGANAVVPVEWTKVEGNDEEGWASVDGSVIVDRGIEAGKHVRPAAEDVRAGQRVLRAGTVITPPVVGVLAGLGVDRLAVQFQPRVRIVSTGDEIVDPASDPVFGQVRNTNGPGLAAQALLAGGRLAGDGRAWTHVPDDLEALTGQVAEAVRRADVVVLSGGVSMGAHDHVQDALRAAGVELLFWKVRQRPGKPLLYGRAGHCHVFGLPGNPVSAAMGFEMYVRPLMETMAGRTPADWSAGEGLVTAILEEDIRKPEGLHTFVRGVARPGDEGWRVRTTGAQGSNLYGSVLQANCVVHVPEGVAAPAAGWKVSIQWLPWAIPVV